VDLPLGWWIATYDKLFTSLGGVGTDGTGWKDRSAMTSPLPQALQLLARSSAIPAASYRSPRGAQVPVSTKNC
jgi:hypothetical protein